MKDYSDAQGPSVSPDVYLKHSLCRNPYLHQNEKWSQNRIALLKHVIKNLSRKNAGGTGTNVK